MIALKRFSVVVLAALALVASMAASAQACTHGSSAPVFKPWGDARYYELGPDGGFEGGAAGWRLSGGAGVVNGNESFFLNGTDDSHALALPAGSSAVSPSVCMSLDTPVFRLLARNSGDPTSRLRVEAVYPLLGLIRTKTISSVAAGPAWAPAQPMSTVLTLSTIVGTLIPSSVQIRITPIGAGDWQVDDLYVDPFARH
ncbi:MAG TPA: hypothetical protein VFJ99_01720 [Solirubrobacterales bacterium]|nr:hypothetical protein [Solirubrobacterales bacterium]